MGFQKKHLSLLGIFETMKKALVILFLFIGFSGIEKILAAGMPPPPPGGGMDPPCWPPPCVPADNGIIFLMIAGALYALKKYYDHKQKRSNTI